MKKEETVTGMCTLERRAARAGCGRRSVKETVPGPPFSSEASEEMEAAPGCSLYG